MTNTTQNFETVKAEIAANLAADKAALEQKNREIAACRAAHGRINPLMRSQNAARIARLQDERDTLETLIGIIEGAGVEETAKAELAARAAHVSPAVSPFKSLFGSEVLADVITSKALPDMIIALLAVSLTHGVDRVEAAIKATYPAAGARQVIAAFNQAMRIFAS